MPYFGRMRILRFLLPLTLIFLSCISKPVLETPECIESWEHLVHTSEIVSGSEKIKVKLVSYLKCKFGGRMSFPSPRYGYNIYLSVFARPYTFVEDVESPDTVTADALESVVQTLKVSISPDQRHFAVQRQGDDIAQTGKLFHLLDAGPAFGSAALDSTVKSWYPLNWKKIPTPEKIAFKILTDYSGDSEPFESFTSKDLVEAVLDSPPVSEIDSVIFSRWPYCGKKCEALVERRLAENRNSTLSFFHKKFAPRYTKEFSQIAVSDIIIYDGILQMICLLPDTSALTKVTHQMIWSYAVETNDEDLRNLPHLRKRQLCDCLGTKREKLPTSRLALVETLCTGN